MFAHQIICWPSETDINLITRLFHQLKFMTWLVDRFMLAGEMLHSLYLAILIFPPYSRININSGTSSAQYLSLRGHHKTANDEKLERKTFLSH